LRDGSAVESRIPWWTSRRFGNTHDKHVVELERKFQLFVPGNSDPSFARARLGSNCPDNERATRSNREQSPVVDEPVGLQLVAHRPLFERHVSLEFVKRLEWQLVKRAQEQFGLRLRLFKQFFELSELKRSVVFVDQFIVLEALEFVLGHEHHAAGLRNSEQDLFISTRLTCLINVTHRI